MRFAPWLLLLCLGSTTAKRFPCASVSECLSKDLYHLPGPNPIVSPRGNGTWASTECEIAGGVFEDKNGTYYLIYHCLGGGTSYQSAISTASHPLGPWTHVPSAPQLPNGGANSGKWDKDVAASFNILPDPSNPGQWLGWYEGGMGAEQCNATQPNPGECWTLGLARAPHPLGPWTKHPEPVLEGRKVCDSARTFSGSCGGLYVASVMHGEHTNHEYWMYMEAPISQENDEGPIALWTAKEPLTLTRTLILNFTLSLSLSLTHFLTFSLTILGRHQKDHGSSKPM